MEAARAARGLAAPTRAAAWAERASSPRQAAWAVAAAWAAAWAAARAEWPAKRAARRRRAA
eukprot:13176930-Alexandrium_andersonii.AAC.1